MMEIYQQDFDGTFHQLPPPHPTPNGFGKVIPIAGCYIAIFDSDSVHLGM